MYRSLKFKLNATESGVAGGRLADLMRTKTWKDKWSIFSITLLFHLSIHFVHQIDVRRVAFSSSPLVCFCIRNFTFAMSSSVCVNRYPFAVSTTEICQERKIKIWARRLLLVITNPHNRMANQKQRKPYYFGILRTHSANACVLLLIQLAIFSYGTFPRMQNATLFWLFG